MNNKNKQEAERSSLKEILDVLNLKKAYEKYGEKNVKWALNRFLSEQRERSKLLKQKEDAEAQLKALDNKSL